MNTASPPGKTAGVLSGLSAYLAWGFVALYFKLLTDRGVSPAALLAHRVIWSTLFCGLLVFALGAGGDALRLLRDPPKMLALLASASMLSANWLTFIYSIHINQFAQSALGYYINPLASVVLAAVVLRERLRAVEWASVGLAVVGVGVIIFSRGGLPWIALVVAFSFAFYSVIRKKVAIPPVIGLAIETAWLVPAAVLFLIWPGLDNVVPHTAGVFGLLALSGVITAIPLLLFAQAARVLRLSTLGFLQYLSPTCQFMLAVFVWHEPISRLELAGFVPIWIGLALFTFDAARRHRADRRPPVSSPAGPKDATPIGIE